jgi:signal transduction histidine kinase
VSLAENAPPSSVLIISQSEARGPFSTELLSVFRSTIKTNTDSFVATYVEGLDLARFSGTAHDDTLRQYLKNKYRTKQISVVVAFGSAALAYALRSKAELWPDVPVVFALVDESTFRRLDPPRDFTGTVMRYSLADAMSVAQITVPGLKRVALVGNAWENQTLFNHWKNELPAQAASVELIDLMGLPLRQLRQRIAALPDDTAILYTSISVDGEYPINPPADAFGFVAEAANRPIVASSETSIGRGAIGGFVLSPSAAGESAARLVVRVLNGENPKNIPVTAANVVRPVFDWRQMQRWNVSESSLPSGSEIRFRDPTLWAQYRKPVIMFCAALLLQAILISWLIYEHRRRHLAEVQGHNSISELMQLNRIATAGELSASIAHEINQPLTGISTKASAALKWLRTDRPDLQRLQVTLEQIVEGSHRAADIIKGLRAMFKKDTQVGLVDINHAILAVLELVRIEFKKSDIDVKTKLTRLPAVTGDEVQLQQVVLNLIMNAVDAMQAVTHRILRVTSALTETGAVHVSIEDTGTGIDPANIDRVFSPLYTTKPSGMGMGLSICQTIIENHGGRLWVEAAAERGSIFRFELPTALSKGRH